ncbi:o-succinylbenzoate--CoA ligase [Mycolicibacterium novocastrense]|uniref:o-succinylbenzoate--CoA ligase n=1 Tax=Mycolicibacterium novocastrense TaxID=59813 RepID=UPI0022872035|nr:o-succinylbenzoate--CoA ligase [Mycolicibacterium novocastrense]
MPVVHDMLAGRATVLPIPAEDDRESSFLTTALRCGAEIDDDVAVVVPTSGTTGTPKGAMLSAAALTASAEATHHRLGGPGRWLLALAAHHIAGLQVLVRSVVAGTTPVALAPSFDPSELPSAINALGSGRRYASLVAIQLDKALRDERAADALAALDAVLIGGGPMPAGLAERAAAAGISVVRTYGMSETAGGCVYDGVPLDGVRVRILDGGQPATSNGGRIVLGGRTLAKGYRNTVDPDPFADAGWFRTDDVGVVDAEGRLTVLGRVDDAIGSGGLTIMPQIVEAVLATHDVVAECAVFGVPDERLGQRVAAAVVLVAGRAFPTDAELREHVAATLDATAAPREFHVVDELPRRGIGKIDRRALAARFQN